GAGRWRIRRTGNDGTEPQCASLSGLAREPGGEPAVPKCAHNFSQPDPRSGPVAVATCWTGFVRLENQRADGAFVSLDGGRITSVYIVNTRPRTSADYSCQRVPADLPGRHRWAFYLPHRLRLGYCQAGACSECPVHTLRCQQPGDELGLSPRIG